MPQALLAAKGTDERPSRLPPSFITNGAGQELVFRFASMVSRGRVAHGWCWKRLFVRGHVPDPSELDLQEELLLVISCHQIDDLNPLILRPAASPS
jgi:hypothetical protein